MPFLRLMTRRTLKFTHRKTNVVCKSVAFKSVSCSNVSCAQTRVKSVLLGFGACLSKKQEAKRAEQGSKEVEQAKQGGRRTAEVLWPDLPVEVPTDCETYSRAAVRWRILPFLVQLRFELSSLLLALSLTPFRLPF